MSSGLTGALRRRVVLTANGSLGDLHPYIAIALGLRARGHDAVIATGECYRRKVEALGLPFRPVRPDSDFVGDPDVMRRFMDGRWGTIRVLRDFVLPALRDSYDDLLAAAEGADLLVSHTIAFAARLVAEVRGLAWASTMITPQGVFSAYDPPLIPGFAGLSRALRPLGPAFWGPLGWSLKRLSRPMAAPVDRLRRELGLPRAPEANPLVDGHSPALLLGLFSSVLADKQRDWPPQTVITGFPVYDRDGDAGMPPELARFLDDGPPPVVFTPASSAAAIAGRFYEESLEAAVRIGRRAVLVGKVPARTRLPLPLHQGMIAVDYVPFSELFPRAAAVVHPGGIGTTGLSMRAGRPSLVVPFAHDQPNNGDRLSRLGVARVLPSRRYNAARVAAELSRVLDEPGYASRAAKVAEQLRGEDGVGAACDVLEATFLRGGEVPR